MIVWAWLLSNWRVVALGACVAAVVGYIALSQHWKHQAAVEAAKAKVATDNAAARTIEAQGERETTQRVIVTVQQAKAAQDATATLSEAARTAPDAQTPIDPDRLERIRRNDLSLCELAALTGCPAKAANAVPGQ